MTRALGQWEENGLRLVVLRRGGIDGYLCGYVGVPAGHPLHGLRHYQCLEGCPGEKVETPRGEVTAYPCVSKGSHLSLNKVLGPDLNSSAGGDRTDLPCGLWFFGVDFAHSHDLYRCRGGETPGAKYVTRETRRLARKLSLCAGLQAGSVSV